MGLPSIGYIMARLFTRQPVAVRGSTIDKKASVGNGAVVVNSTIGRYSYVYGSSLIETDAGAFCSIASGCSIGGGKHPVDFVSTSPVFYNRGNVLHKNFANTPFDEFTRTTIGNDVWIGAKCLIKGGVTIGDGAIIGMGSVVTHDIPPYEIWGGNPAKCIRKRFDDETIAKLQKIQWWNWDEDKLQKYGELFCDPQKLLKELEDKA